MENVSVQDLDRLSEEIFNLRIEKDEREEALSEVNKKLSDLKNKAVAILQQLDRKNYHAPAGLISLSKKINVKTPKSEQEKTAFFEYLRSKGGEALVQDFISINNAKLVSFIGEELDAREEEGNLDISFPGIGDPSFFMDLKVRKA